MGEYWVPASTPTYCFGRPGGGLAATEGDGEAEGRGPRAEEGEETEWEWEDEGLERRRVGKGVITLEGSRGEWCGDLAVEDA